MNTRWIPFKNNQLNEEERYLNVMLEKGLVLKKRGNLFYYFEHVPMDSLKDLYVKILFVDKSNPIQNNQLPKSSTLLYERKTSFPEKRILYFLTSKDIIFVPEESSLLKWYQKSEGTYLNYGNLFGIMTGMIFVLALTSFNIPTFFYLIFPILAIFTMFNYIKASSYFDGSKKILHGMGRLTGFEPEYILEFSKPISKENEIGLSSIGYLKKINDTVFKIKLPMKEYELKQHIANICNLEPTNFFIAQLGELYVIF